MGTQIYINPNQCKPEFTKIVAHSFSMGISESNALFYGGNNSPSGQAIWSRDIYDYQNSRFAPFVSTADKTVGIPLPINLVADDIVTLSGTAYFNNTSEYIDQGWEVYFSLGVYYFDCTYNQGPETPAFTFIPVATYPITVQTKGSIICFEEMVTLNSNFDIHETRFLVGFSVYVICPEGGCEFPIPAQLNLATVSYTLDIERPCAVITSESNFIIRNCCEPIITELVNIPGLTVGSFHVDDEGNCWEVISASNDVTNFTRNFTDIYTSCVECQTANPCPLNLKIESCCVEGQEFVTGSLPGLEVGDTFVDNHGLCWYVSDTTGGPISEESITVVTEIIGDCIVCTDANPCPDLWFVEACCTKIIEVIATTNTTMNAGDSFVDTNGICWAVIQKTNILPTNYDIVVDTVYSMTPTPFLDNCEQCIFYNPCPLEYFLTVRACCDNDRVEVISVPSQYMSFNEGTIFSDPYNLCWEVMSYSTTGVETYSINWDFFFSGYPTCDSCISAKGKPLCTLLWEVRDCATDLVYTVSSNASPAVTVTIGSFYVGSIGFGEQKCFEVLGYGYPASGISGQLYVSIEFGDCEECTIALPGTKVVELQPCCGGPNVIIETTVGFSGGIGAAYIFSLNGIDKQCYTLVGYSVSSPSFINPPNSGGAGDCSICIQKYKCV